MFMTIDSHTSGDSTLRFDQQVVASWITEGARVLDLGCGKGELLQYLVQEKKVLGYGIERNEDAASAAIASGLNVVYGDINDEIVHFPEKYFDFVIVSQTMQQIYNPSQLLRSLLHVGKRAIVSFPNFGYWKVRIQAMFSGRAPKTRELPYQWYDTPNIRVLTLDDFKYYGKDIPFSVKEEVALAMQKGDATPTYVKVLPNLRASYGIYMIEGQ